MNHSSDDLDDLALPQRPRRPEARTDYRSDSRIDGRGSAREDLLDDMASHERELTLSTGTVLALFFGLALICAVFFGFGYSMGRKSAVAAAPIADAGAASTDATDGTGAVSGVAKPSAGSPAVVPTIPAYQGTGGESASGAATALRVPKPATTTGGTSVTLPMDTPAVPKAKPSAVDPDAQIVETHAPARPVITPATSDPAAAVPMPAAGSGSTYVQIAAVSHKEDADVLLSALKRRGYSVFARPGDGDKLIHVQVGPYPTKKDAEVMRQKLLGDGYNAILK